MSDPLTRTDEQSFKPVISLLPVASNLREQILLRQHSDNLEDENLINDLKYAYMRRKSTAGLLVHIVRTRLQIN